MPKSGRFHLIFLLVKPGPAKSLPELAHFLAAVPLRAQFAAVWFGIEKCP